MREICAKNVKIKFLIFVYVFSTCHVYNFNLVVILRILRDLAEIPDIYQIIIVFISLVETAFLETLCHNFSTSSRMIISMIFIYTCIYLCRTTYDASFIVTKYVEFLFQKFTVAVI